MPDIYTHPNGHTVQRNSVGASIVNRGEDYKTPLNADQVDALRHFFLHELGLWRDLESGMIVCINSWSVNRATVLNPATGLCAQGWLDPCDGLDEWDVPVVNWRASLTPPPREPQPGEVWRITLDDGTSRNVLVHEYAWYVSGFPADRRRILVEADGTVVSDE